MKLKIIDPRIEKIIILSLILANLIYIGVVITTADRLDYTLVYTQNQQIDSRISYLEDSYNFDSVKFRNYPEAILDNISIAFYLEDNNTVCISIHNNPCIVRYLHEGWYNETFFMNISIFEYSILDIDFMEGKPLHNYFPILISYSYQVIENYYK